MKNRKSKIVNHKSKKYLCANHPERYAWVERLGAYLCYECAYGKTLCDGMLGESFYEPGGPGYAGEDDID